MRAHNSMFSDVLPAFETIIIWVLWAQFIMHSLLPVLKARLRSCRALWKTFLRASHPHRTHYSPGWQAAVMDLVAMSPPTATLGADFKRTRSRGRWEHCLAAMLHSLHSPCDALIWKTPCQSISNRLLSQCKLPPGTGPNWPNSSNSPKADPASPSNFLKCA